MKQGILAILLVALGLAASAGVIEAEHGHKLNGEENHHSEETEPGHDHGAEGPGQEHSHE